MKITNETFLMKLIGNETPLMIMIGTLLIICCFMLFILWLFTVISTFIMLISETDRNYIATIRREYGLIGPYRMGAVYCSKKWPELHNKGWDPFSSTIMYGISGSILQFFILKSSDEKYRKKRELFMKLIDKDNGYDA